MKPPIPANEKARMSALRGYDILDTLPEPAYDDIVKLASFICQTPIALVTLVDEERQWFKAAQGLDGMTQTPRDVSFCAHAILEPQQVMVVPDATKDGRFADNPLVTGEPQIRFYAGAPLVAESGEALGTLCVIDSKPHQISPEQQESLRALARQVMAHLELHRYAKEIRNIAVERDQLAQAARAFADEVNDLYNHAPCGYHSLDEKGVFVRLNDTELRWLGYQPHEIIEKLSIFDIVAPARRAEYKTVFEQLKAQGRISEVETEFVRKDGSTFPVLVNAAAIYGKEGRFLAARSSVFDITQRKQSEQLLQRSEARFHTFMDNGPVIAYIKDATGCFVYVNRPLLERFERSPAEIIGKCDLDLWSPEVAGQLRENDRQILAGDKVVSIEESLPTPDGIIRDWLSFKFPLREPDGSKLLAAMSLDITERKFYERQMESYQKQLEGMVTRLEELAATDSLTGLKNKGAFDGRINEEWERARRYGLALSLTVLDIDYFKQYNDSFGHPAGDEALKLFAEILRHQARPSDFVARIGGEEFAMILANTDLDGAVIVAERIRRAIETAAWPLRAITASFGVAATPQTPDPVTLIERADKALYVAKQKGRNRVARAGE